MAAAHPTALHPVSHGASKLSEKEIFELRQYQKIIQICETITAGSVATIHTGIPSEPSRHDAARSSRAYKSTRGISVDKDNAAAGLPVSRARGTAAAAAKPAFNPILLQKSDELVTAELRLKRQRLEDALKDDVDQRRAAKTSQPESLSDLDLSEVLERALAMVEASAGTAEAQITESTTANLEATSESIDDSTFYSSRHDTPESHMTSRTQNESELIRPGKAVEQIKDSSSSQQAQPHLSSGSDQAVAVPGLTFGNHSSAPLPAGRTVTVPGLSNYVPHTQTYVPGLDTSVRTDFTGAGYQVLGSSTLFPAQGAPSPPFNEAEREGSPYSPVLREHDLEPFAPQPTHPSSVSVLAASAQSLGAGTRGGFEATPAQVTALRHDANVATSSDSSSYEVKKKGKRKRRKGDRVPGPENASVPYIKREPRSISPVTAPAYIRPTKRQRQTRAEVEQAAFNNGYGQAIPRRPLPPQAAQPYLARSQSAMYGPSWRNPPRAYSTGVAHNAQFSGEAFADGHGAMARGDLASVPAAYSPRTMPAERPQLPVYHEASGYAIPQGPNEGARERERLTGFTQDSSYVEHQRHAYERQAVPVYGAYGADFVDQPYRLLRRAPGGVIGYAEVPELYEEYLPRQVSRDPRMGLYEGPGAAYDDYGAQYLPSRRVLTQPVADFTQEFGNTEDLPHLRQTADRDGLYARSVVPQERRAAEAEVPSRATSLRPAAPRTAAGGRRPLTRVTQPYHMASTNQTEEIYADDFQETIGAFAPRPIRRVQSVVHADPRMVPAHYHASSNLNAPITWSEYLPPGAAYAPSPVIPEQPRRRRPRDP